MQHLVSLDGKEAASVWWSSVSEKICFKIVLKFVGKNFLKPLSGIVNTPTKTWQLHKTERWERF